MMVKSFPDASFPEIHSQCGYLSDIMEARATAVGLLGLPQQAGFPCQMLLGRAFGLPPICPSILSLVVP